MPPLFCCRGTHGCSPPSPTVHTQPATPAPHVLLRGHKEEGLGGVEQHPHHAAAVLPERVLARAAAQLVHQHSLMR